MTPVPGTDGFAIRPAHLHIVEPALAARVAVAAYDAMPLDAPIAPTEPLSYLHVLHGPDGTEPSDDNRRALRRMLDDGVFRPAPSRGFAWYRLAAGEHTQTGLLAEVSIDEYDRGRILRHEHTRADREEQIAAYQAAVAADAGPVALAYHDDLGLEDLRRVGTARPPALRYTADDGVEHAVWTVDDEDEIASLTVAARTASRLYITDGHHRFAAASRLAAAHRAAGGDRDHPVQWMLAALFPADDLRILPFHRAVRRPRDMTADEIVQRIGERAEVTCLPGPRTPSRTTEFVMWLDACWYGIAVPPARSPDPLASLEVTLLQHHVLGPALAVHEPRLDPRLSYVTGGPDAVAAHCARHDAVGFLVRATSMAQLMAVADADLAMPPKSTLFSPKTRAGIVIRLTG